MSSTYLYESFRCFQLVVAKVFVIVLYFSSFFPIEPRDDRSPKSLLSANCYCPFDVAGWKLATKIVTSKRKLSVNHDITFT